MVRIIWNSNDIWSVCINIVHRSFVSFEIGMAFKYHYTLFPHFIYGHSKISCIDFNRILIKFVYGIFCFHPKISALVRCAKFVKERNFIFSFLQKLNFHKSIILRCWSNEILLQFVLSHTLKSCWMLILWSLILVKTSFIFFLICMWESSSTTYIHT